MRSDDSAATLAQLRSTTSAFVLGLESERWTDDDVRQPSLLPGWTRAHVLTHIARNADGISRTISGALRGEMVERYPDGPAGRNADIEAGSSRGVLELMADVRESAERLDRLFAALADADGWELPTPERPAGRYTTARWREVEVHRIDLGGAYGPTDWPPVFVSYLVPKLITTLDERAESALRIDVAEDGSITTDLPGQSWDIGTGDPTEVSGPDWAILAWLAGRPAPAAELSATPPLGPWI
jgi:maleylpyruvate isomerase